MADDFVGMEPSGGHYDKADTLQFVSRVCVPEYEMQNVQVILLNGTSALVTYDIHYKTRTTGKQVTIEDTFRHALRAWSQRDGKWRYGYYEDRMIDEEWLGFNSLRTGAANQAMQWFLRGMSPPKTNPLDTRELRPRQ